MHIPRPRKLLAGLLATLALTTAAPAVEEFDYAADVDFALEELEKRCGALFELKDIDWKRVGKQFRSEVKQVETPQEHLVLLTRLLARVRDGHAAVKPLEKGAEVRWPEQPEKQGPGLFLCKSGKRILIKNAWNAGASAGITPGMELVKVDGQKAAKWLDERIATLSDLRSFSTDHQAFFYACHWGLEDEAGTRLKLELKDEKGKSKKRTLTYGRANTTPSGPAFFPQAKADWGRTKDLNFVRLDSGLGYVHVRRCKGDLPAQMDEALAVVADTRGLILDFRGNSGGGFDHDDLLGRFVPAGHELAFLKKTPSTGPLQFGGPVVVIIDATVRSAGETGAGMFKEEGRAYMIGESPTAGMSAQKETIELPSGLFGLYVAVRSNKSYYQDGRGIEGLGVEPHELVEFDQEDLFAERDTLILRAEALLEDFPSKQVPYDPDEFGWSPPD